VSLRSKKLGRNLHINADYYVPERYILSINVRGGFSRKLEGEGGQGNVLLKSGGGGKLLVQKGEERMPKPDNHWSTISGKRLRGRARGV